MKTTLGLCLFLATHVHAESIAPSIPTSTPAALDSSPFDMDEELTTIAASCLSLQEHEQLLGQQSGQFPVRGQSRQQYLDRSLRFREEHPLFDDRTGTASAYSATTGSWAGQWISSECEKVEMAYILFSSLVNHETAERTCTSYGGNLVTIKNSIENRAISTFVGTSVSQIWIGLYCFNSLQSGCLWDDASGSATVYDNFASGFPYESVGNCVYYLTTGNLAGRWVSGECDNLLSAAVCELPPTFADSCSYNFDGNCYSMPTGPQTFSNAQLYCESQSANLVSIHSFKELRFIISTFSSYNSIFLGGFLVTTNMPIWIDRSAWNYSNFDTGSLSAGNCIKMATLTSGNYLKGTWYASDCGSSGYYVCKSPAGTQNTTTAPPVTISPSSSPSCNTTILMTPGTFTSPHYPSNYDNNLFCTYSLATLGAYRINLQFVSFNTEQKFDSVFVYDGNSLNAPQIGNLSGGLTTPINFQSTANTLFVTFKTDNSNVYSGFSAKFAAF
ncbi:unnamed protein product [Caenorhabditis sp. 36 PRJEB53466]|nr:unnamed protein product [Caenorhabditis sp. 36 PRJEB53466]